MAKIGFSRCSVWFFRVSLKFPRLQIHFTPTISKSFLHKNHSKSWMGGALPFRLWVSLTRLKVCGKLIEAGFSMELWTMINCCQRVARREVWGVLLWRLWRGRRCCPIHILTKLYMVNYYEEPVIWITHPEVRTVKSKAIGRKNWILVLVTRKLFITQLCSQ